MTITAQEIVQQQVGQLYEALLVEVDGKNPNVTFGALTALTATCILTFMIEGGLDRTPENVQRFAERFKNQLTASLTKAIEIEARGAAAGESIIIQP